MKILPILLIMVACAFSGDTLNLLKPHDQVVYMLANNMIDILPLDSVPRELQIPIIVVANYDKGKVTPKGGEERSGKIKSDAIVYLSQEYPLTGVYMARREDAPYLVVFTPTLYFFLVQLPPDMLEKIGCRYMLQVIGREGTSYSLHIR